MKYKKGDKVAVRRDLELGTWYQTIQANTQHLCAPRLVTIHGVHPTFECYSIEENHLLYSEQMFAGLDNGKDQQIEAGQKLISELSSKNDALKQELAEKDQALILLMALIETKDAIIERSFKLVEHYQAWYGSEK
jgi:hypothetical protein